MPKEIDPEDIVPTITKEERENTILNNEITKVIPPDESGKNFQPKAARIHPDMSGGVFLLLNRRRRM